MADPEGNSSPWALRLGGIVYDAIVETAHELHGTPNFYATRRIIWKVVNRLAEEGWKIFEPEPASDKYKYRSSDYSEFMRKKFPDR
jgi:hypothetical protein